MEEIKGNEILETKKIREYQGRKKGGGVRSANSKSESSYYSLSALNKENLLEFLLYWSIYLYMLLLVCAHYSRTSM